MRGLKRIVIVSEKRDFSNAIIQLPPNGHRWNNKQRLTARRGELIDDGL
jgi:hypothetical protein